MLVLPLHIHLYRSPVYSSDYNSWLRGSPRVNEISEVRKEHSRVFHRAIEKGWVESILCPMLSPTGKRSYGLEAPLWCCLGTFPWHYKVATRVFVKNQHYFSLDTKNTILEDTSEYSLDHFPGL
ncbi:hypothetical protein JTE90_003957 [Oedothorax gibbosus]|uniref:Uncharacterized protein n=1 Tax=Oedothorax gibbosus TaxID=931172 RepID=A0AAV6UZK6_9ARAC|nr:hypothetical protein JTE90_003957 [Oedothorax gibbosus]